MLIDGDTLVDAEKLGLIDGETLSDTLIDVERLRLIDGEIL